MEIEAALERRTAPQEANQTVRLLLGSYPNRSIPDAEVYVRQIVCLLCEYPPFVAEQIAHPTRGIVADHPFLPSLSEIKAFADEMVVARRVDRQRLLSAVEAERWREADQARLAPPPTPEEQARLDAERLARLQALGAEIDRASAEESLVGAAVGETRFPPPERRMSEAEAEAQLDRDRKRFLAQFPPEWKEFLPQTEVLP